MDAPATLVWIAPDPPDAAQSRALSSWARAHGVVLATPRDEPPPALQIDEGIADAVETLLDRARDAITARDADAADQALSSADAMLRGHPELPQAAWLMAEVERARASRWQRVAPTDAEAADRAWLRAEALDGGRVAGVGEQATVARPSPSPSPWPRPAAATIALEVVPSQARTLLDGHPVQPGSVATRAGPHALVITWDGAPVWAGWLETPPGTSSLRAAAPAAPACSSGDVLSVRLDGDGERIDASAVRCAQWVAAAPSAKSGVVRVATCEPHACGALLEWRAPASPGSWTWTPPPERRRPGWPSWATWGLVGAGAVIAAGVGVLASGVLQPAPTETRFVSGGIKSQ